MKRLFPFLLIILIYSCTTNTSEILIEDLIPERSSVILKINDIDAFTADSKNNVIVNTLLNKKLDSIISVLETIQPKSEVFICFDETSSKSKFSIIGTLNDSLPKLNFDLHHKYIDSIFILSTSKELITNIQPNNNSNKKRFQALNKNASYSIFINDEKINTALGSSLIENKIQEFSESILTDIEISPEEIQFNGISFINDSINNVLDVFKQITPQENKISDITPLISDSFLSITFEDYSSFQYNLAHFNKQALDSLNINTPTVFETVNEIGIVYIDDVYAIALKSIDLQTTRDALIEFQDQVSSYRNIPIFNFNNATVFKNTLNPFITPNPISKFIVLDDFFIFSDSEIILHQIISNYQNGSVLSKSDNYKSIKSKLNDESSLLIFGNSQKLHQIIKTLFREEFNTNLFEGYNFNAFQFIIEDNVAHINGILKKEKSKPKANTINEVFNINIENNLLNDPQFVINHRTNQKEIIVQDINNVLYLISNKGKILWKKNINGNILGRIQQVDLYKNSRLQLAFATPNRVYILDRNGNDVSPFPLRFNDKITQPLSIFDYDNRKDYRFLITQNDKLLMYDKKGKRVNGFKYQSSNTINTQPKHFRISGKDYIVFAAGNMMKILSRQGNDRIKVNESINFSGNSIYKYKDKFTTSSQSGALVQINLKGNVSEQVLNLQENHTIESTNKTLVTLSDNILTIKQKSVELDFGNYTTPKLFYLNDKIYISTTDLQTQKIYLYDSQARLITNFPIYGNSAIDLDNIDRDSNLEFVTKGDENSIILYQKN